MDDGLDMTDAQVNDAIEDDVCQVAWYDGWQYARESGEEVWGYLHDLPPWAQEYVKVLRQTIYMLLAQPKR